jgi:hypothetical protein
MPENVFPFRPVDDSRTTTTTLTVTIKYLHHRKPHHRDSEARRQEKATISALARTHEGTRVFEYPRALERWSAADVKRAIDLVRAAMPLDAPDGHVSLLRPDSEDPFAADGRALHYASFNAPGRNNSVLLRSATIWFSTRAGYEAKIQLPAVPPMAAIIPWALDEQWGAKIDLHLKRAR